jgi:hypothetical protein
MTNKFKEEKLFEISQFMMETFYKKWNCLNNLILLKSLNLDKSNEAPTRRKIW